MNLFSKIVTILFVPLLLSTANAKDLEWSDGPYTHYSDQEPLRNFLVELAATQKTPITISEKVNTVISGYYRDMPPKEIFLDVVKANALLWYYDGDTLYINTEDEIQTGSVSLEHSSATDFTHSLERLGILDHYYHWVTSDVDKMVYFKGPEPFVTEVLEMSKVLDKPSKTASIYQWVDSRGITHFSERMPKKYQSSNDVKIIKKDKGVVVLGEPRVKE